MERGPPVPGLSTEPGARSATSDSAGEWREKDGGGRAGGRAGTGGGTGRHSGGDGLGWDGMGWLGSAPGGDGAAPRSSLLGFPPPGSPLRCGPRGPAARLRPLAASALRC